eukprot:COSAG02_NODE_2830_length_7936_cov_40.231849_1_plen_65_part_00
MPFSSHLENRPIRSDIFDFSRNNVELKVMMLLNCDQCSFATKNHDRPAPDRVETGEHSCVDMSG